MDEEKIKHPINKDNPDDLRPCDLDDWDVWVCREINCVECHKFNQWVLSVKTKIVP